MKFGQIPGDNTEKIWAHRFLEKPNKIAAGGLGGAVSSKEYPVWCLLKAWMQSGETIFFFLIFCIKHAKTVIVKVNIG